MRRRIRGEVALDHSGTGTLRRDPCGDLACDCRLNELARGLPRICRMAVMRRSAIVLHMRHGMRRLMGLRRWPRMVVPRAIGPWRKGQRDCPRIAMGSRPALGAMRALCRNHTASRNVSRSRMIRPAVAPAKCVPITSTGVPASFSNISHRVRMPCAASLSAVVSHSGCAI